MGLPALLADYLFLPPLVKQRLELKVPDMPVDVVETADQILEAERRSQVLCVMWAGEGVKEGEPGTASRVSQMVEHRILVWLALNNVGRSEKDSRQLRAGPLMSQTHIALTGWIPEGATRPFMRANAALRPLITPQKAIYPMGFKISLSL